MNPSQFRCSTHVSPMLLRLLIIFGVTATFASSPACSGDSSAKAKKTGDAPKAPAKPTLSLSTGTVDLKTSIAWTAPIVERYVKDGAVYLRANVPGSPDPEKGVSSDRTYDVILDPPHKGFAVIESPSVSGVEQPQLFVRLVGDQIPTSLTLQVFDKGPRFMSYHHDHRTHHTLTLTHFDTAKDEPETPQRFFTAAQLYFQTWATLGFRSRSAFASFAAARSSLLAGGSASANWDPQEARSDDLTEMMSLYTGALSIQEALQSDRGLLLGRAPDQQPSIPIADVPPVPLVDHPFAKMIESSGKKPQMEPLASRVPANFLYFTFHEMRDAVALLNDFEEWLWPLAQLVEGRGDAANLASRYQEQLAVERTRLAEVLGPLAVEEIAFAASDPFLREGADLSILFKLKRRELLLSALDLYEQSARKKHPNLTVAEYKIGTLTVRHLSTPDEVVNQHRVEWDDILLLSNSRKAVELFIAVRDKKAPSLAQSPDFQYMRTLYPFSVADERGFVFIGDEFVRHAISPRTKILQARRMAARADLLSAGFVVLYHGWLYGTAATSTDELTQKGLLRPEDLRHTDGTPIELSVTTGARSTTFGTAYRLRPLLDLDISMVTEAEKLAYERFATTYQNNWKGYIDPIAIRIQRSNDGKNLSLDARMIPLIEATEYDEILQLVGKATARPPAVSEAMQWTFAVGSDAKLRKELDTLASGLGETTLSFGWLGDWVAIGVQESSVLWDLAVMSGEVPQKPNPERRRDIEWELLAKSPIYVGAHVKNGLGLATTLTAIRSMVHKSAPGLVEWGPDETWHGVPMTAIRPSATAPVPDDNARSMGLYYATPKDVIVASLDKDTLKRVIDLVLDGKMTQAVTKPDPSDAQALINGHFADSSWLAQAVLGLAEQGVRQAVGHALYEVEALTRGRVGITPAAADFESTALAFLGSLPSSVHGGTFSLDKWGYPKHSLFGSELSPEFPDIPIKDSPLTRLVQGLRTIRFGLSFEGEGPAQGLRVQMGWTRK